MRKLVLGLAGALLCWATAFSQQAQRNPAGQGAAEEPRSDALRQIIPGHYMYTFGNLNSGVIATSEGVVVLDAVESESVSRAERDAIAKTIGQPVRFLVSSTHHDNYSKGNLAFADVWKIGHQNYRNDLITLLERQKASPEE